MGCSFPLLCFLSTSGAGRAAPALSSFVDSGQALGGNVDSSEVALGDLNGDGGGLMYAFRSASLGAVFAGTSEGQFYIDLYVQHGQEMGQISLEDPALLWDAAGTLQNFLPGQEAFVTGRAGKLLVTQQIVDDALDIWQRIAAAASPEMAGVISTELAKYNNLQDFVGMTFDEWAQALGVQPPMRIFLPVIMSGE